jgi:hypothetical protein
MPETNALRNRMRVCLVCKIAKGTAEHYTFDQWHCNDCAEQSKEEEGSQATPAAPTVNTSLSTIANATSSLRENGITAAKIDNTKNESEAVPSDQGRSTGDVVEIFQPIQVARRVDVPCPTRRIKTVTGPLNEAIFQVNRKAIQ